MFSGTVVGNAGSDGELTYLTDKTPVLNFSVASTNGGKDKGTTWVRTSFFGKVAEKIAGYVKKGKQIAVTGEIQNREWTNKEGVVQHSLEMRANNVQLLGSREDSDSKTDADGLPF